MGVKLIEQGSTQNYVILLCFLLYLYVKNLYCINQRKADRLSKFHIPSNQFLKKNDTLSPKFPKCDKNEI